MRLVLALVALAACEPAYHLDTAIEIPAEDLGNPLVVHIVDGLPWDGTGIPQPMANTNRIVLLATTATERRIALKYDDLFCPRSLYITAWMDRRGSSGLAELLDERTLTDEDYHDDGDRARLHQIAELVPATGDSMAVVGPLDFDTEEGGACDPTVRSIDLVLTPID